MKLKRLPRSVFDQAAAYSNQDARTHAMARAVLVDGRTQVDVAKEYRVTKQRVNGAVKTVVNAYNQRMMPWGGTIRVELDVPESLVVELGLLADALLVCDDADKKAEVLASLLSAIRDGATALAVMDAR
jgi:hypothetical protein